MATTAPATPRARARLGKKEKQALRADGESLYPQRVLHQLPSVVASSGRASSFAAVEPASSSSSASTSANSWPWLALTDTTTTTTCPVIFSPDSAYCFIASGSAVKIYSSRSTQLLSTLSPPSLLASTSAQGSASLTRAKVTALLLNPSNPLQLVVASLDGTIRLWDYYEGKLLRTIDLGAPVLHACGHASLSDHLFVALAAVESDSTPKAPLIEDGEKTSAKKSKSEASANGAHSDSTSRAGSSSESRAGIYSISLRPKALPDAGEISITPMTPRTPARRVRLAHPRIVRSLSVSPSGAHLIAVNPHAINICRTSQLQRGFALQVDSHEALTTLACHPTENYFATGNERGQIRLWYDVLDDESPNAVKANGGKQRGGDKSKDSAASNRSTAVYHWHKHPVASLTFTPNGAYLLSGGEEAVMVLWQLHTGHTEFVPRLGAPILALSITDDEQSEQQIAARLRDGTVVFIGSQRLKISKTISGLKADPVRLSNVAQRPRTRVPLASQPLTKALVLPAGHPSSIQFYSPAEDAQLLELEISPSNRVSSVTDVPIEPTRVERVTFSTPAINPNKVGGSYWMATLDTWIKDSYAPARHLKFWEHRANGSSFVLSTRIDRPHDGPITSMSFSPSPSSPLLLTTSTDGLVKLWSHAGGAWRCQSSLNYRDFTPLDAAWSHDGSMFAVAHSKSVTLWSLASNELIHVFPCSTIAPARTVGFVGEEGTILVAGGAQGSLAWDLLTFEETLNVDFEIDSIASKPRSSLFIATEKTSSRKDGGSKPSPTSTTAYLIDASSPSSSIFRHLPFAVRQTMWYDAVLGSAEDEVSLAVVNDRGEVSLVGAAATLGSQVLPSPLPRAAQLNKAQSRLFDEIYGKGEHVGAPRTTPKRTKAISTSQDKLTTSMNVLDAPAHSLPPVKFLWRTLLGGFTTASSEEKKVESDQPIGTVVDANQEVESAPKPSVASAFVASPDTLAEIFKARLTMANGSTGAKKATEIGEKPSPAPKATKAGKK